MKIKIKSLDVRWYIFYCASLIYAVLQINIVMYMCLVIQLMYIAKSRKKNRNLIEISNLLLITLFLPDNYVIIPIVMLTFFWCIIKRGLRKKIVFWITIVSIYCMLNICINQVHFNNILFSVIYTLPFFMMGYEMEYLISDKKVVDEIVFSMKNWIIIEGMSVILFALTHISTVRSYGDMASIPLIIIHITDFFLSLYSVQNTNNENEHMVIKTLH